MFIPNNIFIFGYIFIYIPIIYCMYNIHYIITWHDLICILLSFVFPFRAGSVCAGRRALPLQWGEHVRVPYFKHREQPSVLHHWKVVHGAPSSTSQTWFWLTRWLYDGKACWFTWVCHVLLSFVSIIQEMLLLLCIVLSSICIVKSYSLNGYCSWMWREINWGNSSNL